MVTIFRNYVAYILVFMITVFAVCCNIFYSFSITDMAVMNPSSVGCFLFFLAWPKAFVISSHLEEQTSQKSSIFTRLAQHFPFVFKLLRSSPSQSNGTSRNNFMVINKIDSNEMENKVALEGIPGDSDDYFGGIENVQNRKPSDLNSLRFSCNSLTIWFS